jgi:predicted outer membrane protein
MVIKALVGGSIIAFAAAATSFVAAQQSSSSDQPGSTQRAAGGQTTGETQNQTTGDNQNATGQNAAGQNALGQNAAGKHGRHDVVHYMRDCLVNGNQAEITLARIAEQRAADPQVKQFAQKMIHDHTAFLSKLQNAAAGNSAEQTGSAQQPGSQPAVGGPGADVNAPGAQVRVQPGESNNASSPADATSRAGGQITGASGARQFVQIEKEVAAQCLQTKTRELNQKEGAQFDRCYMNMQVGAHMKMADELTVYGRYGAGEFQTVCQEGLQTTKEHLTMAKQIAERLDGTNPGTANRNPTGVNQ